MSGCSCLSSYIARAETHLQRQWEYKGCAVRLHESFLLTHFELPTDAVDEELPAVSLVPVRPRPCTSFLKEAMMSSGNRSGISPVMKIKDDAEERRSDGC
ncbi:hypothetical protein ABG768_004088 [Culter alburnus]|uniref:Uncharacterized protein n=1 Tax=Culter alburnus TaxID=194366 RepID=A0AAW1ZTZ2_CULAL